MQLTHVFLAVLIMAMWGFNFVMIQLGLKEFSPLFLCTLRFFLASVPLVFFFKPPSVPLRTLICYGLITFSVQYILLFVGMQVGMSPGLASLLYQTQVFFTIILAALFFQERPTRWQLLGIFIAFLGIMLVASHVGGSVTLLGLLFTIGAAVAWALSNILSKQIGKVNMLSLVVWGNFIAWPPTLLISLLYEGSAGLQHIYHQHLSFSGLIAILYIAYASTLFCFSLWCWLLTRYPLAKVVPFTLMVPVFGMLSSWLAFGEEMNWWKIVAAILIISGLIVNLLGPRLEYFTKKIREVFLTV